MNKNKNVADITMLPAFHLLSILIYLLQDCWEFFTSSHQCNRAICHALQLWGSVVAPLFCWTISLVLNLKKYVPREVDHDQKPVNVDVAIFTFFPLVCLALVAKNCECAFEQYTEVFVVVFAVGVTRITEELDLDPFRALTIQLLIFGVFTYGSCPASLIHDQAHVTQGETAILLNRRRALHQNYGTHP